MNTLINIIGITLNRADFQPMAGVTVSETTSKQKVTTDANGFYSLQVTTNDNEPTFCLKLHWKGRLMLTNDVSLQPSPEPQGQIQIAVLDTVKQSNPYEPLHTQHYPSPANPQYADALAAAQQAIEEYQKTLRFYEMKRSHPEISRFYVTNDGWRRLVLFRDGTLDAYGGPDEPDYATMDVRYAPLPSYMVPNLLLARTDKPR